MTHKPEKAPGRFTMPAGLVFTELELAEVWRPFPDFIGPSEPPMIRVMRQNKIAAGEVRDG